MMFDLVCLGELLIDFVATAPRARPKPSYPAIPAFPTPTEVAALLA